MVVIDGTPGWYPSPADPRVSRYWNGSGWTSERLWNGSAWVDPRIGTPPPTRRRSPAVWWIVGSVAVVALVIALVAVARGGSAHRVSTATFCRDLGANLSTLSAANVSHIVQGNEDDSPLPAEVTAYRAGAAAATKLAGEAPEPPKTYLQGLARGLTANAEHRKDENLADDTGISLGELVAWKAINCPAGS